MPETTDPVVRVQFTTDYSDSWDIVYQWGGSIYVDLLVDGSSVDVINISDELEAFKERFGHRPTPWDLVRWVDLDEMARPIINAAQGDEDEDEDEDEDHCPACGDIADYCAGLGEIGDPEGAAILAAHDNDDHSGCHRLADCL